jgi:hypothetical protein
MLAVSVVRPKSIPVILVSGSQNGFVLVNTGAVAGADIGYPKRSAELVGNCNKGCWCVGDSSMPYWLLFRSFCMVSVNFGASFLDPFEAV